MTSHISPARLPGFLKFIVLALVALTFASLPFSVNAQDTSSSAPAAASSASRWRCEQGS